MLATTPSQSRKPVAWAQEYMDCDEMYDIEANGAADINASEGELEYRGSDRDAREVAEDSSE